MVAQSIFWLTLPAVVYGLLASFLLRSDPPPRWQSRAAAGLGRWRSRRADRRTRRRGQGHGQRRGRLEPNATVDPFDALSIQIRLGAIAAQLRSIEDDPRIWARARRFQATQHAYDDLLAQACLLAGVELDAGELDAGEHRFGRNRTEPERLHEEVELASRGWTW